MLSRIVVLWIVFVGVMGFALGGSFVSSWQQTSRQQIAKANSDEHHATEPEQSRFEWGHSDPGVTVATIALVVVAIFQAFLFWVQLRYMRVGMRDASVVADAARESANAVRIQSEIAQKQLTSIERPHVFIFNVSKLKWEYREWWDGEAEDAVQEFELSVSYSVANYGRIPAIIREIRSNISVFREPLDPLAGDYDHPLVISPILAAGEVRREIPDSLGWQKITTDEGHTVPDFGEDAVYFQVFVEYDGPFTKGHTSRACWIRDARTGQFRPHPDPDYTSNT